VVAPNPLEINYDEVFQSTLKWIQKNLDNKDSYIEFYINNRYMDDPPVASVIRRLIVEAGDTSIAKKIKLVAVPVELLFIDFTLWLFPDGKIRTFANDMNKSGKKYRLWELSTTTSFSLYNNLEKIKKSGNKRIFTLDNISIPKSNNVEIDITELPYVPYEKIKEMENQINN
jgi:hypothetical protein